ncbi:hypothetical protein RFI_03961 [Reticulomyxa filosa]|uniref:Up-regulated in Daf-2 domain-containing protein n=1 Tax=Reticulomyxa filosa TaxID=46433 RepID=X6P6A3_RETFI|nr:hypothetical protein RFI_03961 [Reticulomyxa filosa]|eukprot:ETO33147.1 hypothetical protein RFI_03961 [Reticulomyxa filosa]
MGNGTSCSTTVRVKNNYGCTLDYVTVYHKFRQDGNVTSKTWDNVGKNETTSADFRVYYRVGFGAMTDYDWWAVKFCIGETEYAIDPYFEPSGFKGCYLKEEDERGPVTIIIKSNSTDGIVISPYRSSDASTNYSNKPGGGLRCVTKNKAVQAIAVAGLAAATGGVGTVVASTAVFGITHGQVDNTRDESLAVKRINPYGLELDDKVIELKVFSIWLCHGVVAAPGSVFSSVTGNSVTHWWVQLQTKNAWYCAQFAGSILELTKHSDPSEVTTRGKSCRKTDEKVNITKKFSSKPETRTMRDVVEFMRKYNGFYDLVPLYVSTFFCIILYNCIAILSEYSKYIHILDGQMKKLNFIYHIKIKLYIKYNQDIKENEFQVCVILDEREKLI